jgi:oligopeptide/dipeptide ABC transporter ATP-binding protein
MNMNATPTTAPDASSVSANTATSAPVMLRVEGLVKHFPVRVGRSLLPRRAIVRAVDGVSFELRRGETFALVGESGCGKSTTGRMVLRLIEPTAGRVQFAGKEVTTLDRHALRSLRKDMQIIFQDPYGSLNPRLSARQILGEPLDVHGVAQGPAREARIDELLQLVGLTPEHGRRYPHQFSGGQRQRIAIARALAANPSLIVCDEPVSALDVSIQAQIVNLMKDLQRRLGLMYLFIAHDLAVVKHIADRVAVMYLGRIVEVADKTELFANPRHPYTQALLNAVPLPDPNAKRERAILQGDIPNPIAPPSGCHFHTRCPFAQERCKVDDPMLQPAGPGHQVACHFRDVIPPFGRHLEGTLRSDIFLRRLRAFDRAKEAGQPAQKPVS